MAKKPNRRENKPVLPEREWDMLPNESPQKYERFCWYRDFIYYDDAELKNVHALDITKRRSYRATANHFGLALNTIERDGKAYRWRERCEAYDRYISLLARRDQEKKIVKMLNNHAVLGAAMVQRAAARFISLAENDLSAADTIRMADVGVKIERMARGISGEESTVQITTPKDQGPKPSADVDVPPVFDLTNLSDEELISLEQIVGKLAATDRNES